MIEILFSYKLLLDKIEQDGLYSISIHLTKC